jgi:hypothetical protein
LPQGGWGHYASPKPQSKVCSTKNDICRPLVAAFLVRIGRQHGFPRLLALDV